MGKRKAQPDTVEWIPLREHLEAVRAADQSLLEERDRRYAEVNIEKEKALKIKETADLAALQLARESQTLKDENAEKMRGQIEADRAASPDRYRSDFDKLAANIEQVAKNSAESIRQVADAFEEQLRPVYAFINKFEGTSTGGQQIAQRSSTQNSLRVAVISCAAAIILGIASLIITLTLKG